MTIGAIRALHRLGLQHEVALVGFDDVLLADMLEPAVTVIAQDPAEIGRTAAARVFARLDGDDSPAATYVVPARLIVRGSGESAPVLNLSAELVSASGALLEQEGAKTVSGGP